MAYYKPKVEANDYYKQKIGRKLDRSHCRAFVMAVINYVKLWIGFSWRKGGTHCDGFHHCLNTVVRMGNILLNTLNTIVLYGEYTFEYYCFVQGVY